MRGNNRVTATLARSVGSLALLAGMAAAKTASLAAVMKRAEVPKGKGNAGYGKYTTFKPEAIQARNRQMAKLISEAPCTGMTNWQSTQFLKAQRAGKKPKPEEYLKLSRADGIAMRERGLDL